MKTNKLIKSASFGITAMTASLNAQQEVPLQVTLMQRKQYSARLREEADILREDIFEKLAHRRLCDHVPTSLEREKELEIVAELYRKAAEVGTWSQKLEIGNLLVDRRISIQQGRKILRRVVNVIAPAIYEMGLAFERRGETDAASDVFECCGALGCHPLIAAGCVDLGESVEAHEVRTGIELEKTAEAINDEKERNEQRKEAMTHYMNAVKEGDIPIKIKAARLLIHGAGCVLWNGTNVEEGQRIISDMLPTVLPAVYKLMSGPDRRAARKIFRGCAALGDKYGIECVIRDEPDTLKQCRLINLYDPTGRCYSNLVEHITY
ncbi:MAG: hypothetical protein LBQ43_05385, partial [Holosporales bacterium]|nr:hypothetical protein [Holosporales bacterium]